MPDKATLSFLKFTSELGICELLMVYINIAEELLSTNNEFVVERLTRIYQDQENELSNELVKLLTKNGAESFTQSKSYEHYFCQMAFSRSIDNLITYFKDILAEVINIKPEILKSNETINYEFVLSFDDINELKNALAEKKIEELFYGGVINIKNYFEKRLGVILFDKQDAFDQINYIIKIRNLIVHNRGMVNSEFKKEFPLVSQKVGDSYSFKYEEISKLNLDIQNFIAYTDDKIGSKFNLPLLDNLPG
ncbi:MAG: hypothetical protein KJ869_10200 [Candidatus Edwardsbacteria bacterium]|nr:hypothetical protein [Candidatus Edwardsbacteria bacterium]